MSRQEPCRNGSRGRVGATKIGIAGRTRKGILLRSSDLSVPHIIARSVDPIMRNLSTKTHFVVSPQPRGTASSASASPFHPCRGACVFLTHGELWGGKTRLLHIGSSRGGHAWKGGRKKTQRGASCEKNCLYSHATYYVSSRRNRRRESISAVLR